MNNFKKLVLVFGLCIFATKLYAAQPTLRPGWTKSGTNVYVITTTDNVGIGNTAPAATYKLEVTGNSKFSGDVNITGNLTAVTDQTVSGNITMGDDKWLGLGSSGGLIQFDSTPATDEIEILNSNVGIGNTSPQGLLDAGTTPGTGLIVTTASKVGIGTTAPDSKLTVANGATSAGVIQINEDTDDGLNNATFTVPALAADTDYTLPTTDGNANEFLQTNGSGVLTWAVAGGGTISKAFIITNPTASADSPVWRAQAAVTITAVHVLCVGGTNIVGQLWEYDTNGANGATVDSSDITGTAGSNVNDDGSLSNPSIASGAYVGWKTTSVSGAVTQAIITFDYTVN